MPSEASIAPASDESFYSDRQLPDVSDVDSLVQNNLNWLQLLRRSHLQKEFEEYNNSNQHLTSLVVLIGAITVLCIAYFVALFAAWSPVNGHGDLPNWLVCIVSTPLFLAWCWWSFRTLRRASNGNSGARLSPSVGMAMRMFQLKVFGLLHVFVCYRLISKVIAGSCPTDKAISHQFNFNCNALAEAQALPMDCSLVVMLVPLVYALTVRGAHVGCSLAMWASSVFVLVFCVIYAQAHECIMYVTAYCVLSCVLLAAARWMSYVLFFSHRQLLDYVRIMEQRAAEENAAEMRHLIANVAHDMKTPLASFLAGIELIAQVMQEIKTQSRDESRPELDECLSSIGQCVTNMRNTNSFMLMTINRCIDYTKASKGVKLVPKYETIDLMETLSMPLSCMKDIQQRVSILLEPVARDICSHVITDKQWLQESVLCLLSNAVKYSNEGEARVRVTKASVPIPSARAVSASVVGSFRSLHVSCSAVVERSMVRREMSTEWLRFEVEDLGIGLSDEAMALLFSPFKQAQRLAGGTGLGLFSLERRMEALGGYCGVEHRRDGQQGSLFWFAVPYRPDQLAAEHFLECAPAPHVPSTEFISDVVARELGLRASPAAARTRSGEAAAESPPPLQFPSVLPPLVQPPAREPSPLHPPLDSATSVDESPTISSTTTAIVGDIGGSASPGGEQELLDILVVDDSPAILKMTAMLLRRHKHQVTTAVNGAEGVKLVAQRLETGVRGFDVILMDLQMPVMDGLEATRRIRQMEARTDSAGQRIIVGVSANSDHDTAYEDVLAGMNAFIAKPFTLDLFTQTYALALARRASPPAH